jgi:hypothetical protein
MESRMRWIPAAAVLAVLTACRLETHEPKVGAASASVLAAAADSAAVREELESYYRDFSARDWSAFADHFWPGADITTIWRPPGEPAPRVVVTPVPDFVRQAPQGPGSRPVFEERMLDHRLVTHRDLVQAWVRYRARFGDSTGVSEWEGIDAFTLMRLNGRWRIVELAFLGDTGGP